MSHVVHIGGAKGVGKTTLLRELGKETEYNGHTLHTLQMSGFLNQIALQSFGKQWKEMGDTDRVSARVMAAEALRTSPEGVILLDSHCVDMSGDCPKCIVPEEFKPIIDSYIVLTAPLDVVLKRREKDMDIRTRDLDPKNIAAELECELKVARELSNERGTRVTIIENMVMEDAIRGVKDHIDFVLAPRETRAEEAELNANRFHHNERI